MNFFLLKRGALTLILPLVIFGCIVGCRRAATENIGGDVTNLPQKLHNAFGKTKIVCFGRFVMTVPTETIVIYGPAEVDSSITYIKGGAEASDDYAGSRIREIELERRYLDKDDLEKLPLFGKVMKGERKGQKIVVGSKDQIGYAILSLVPIGNNLFIQEVNGGLPDRNFIGRMNKVANVLRFRGEDEIPSESGMCIDGGFVPGLFEYERATIGIRFKEFPDVQVSIDVHKNLEFLNLESDPRNLHKQAEKAAKAAGLSAVFSRGKILREQSRKIGHWSGQEMAFRTPAYKRAASVHEFRFHSSGSPNDPLHPELDIRLDSGITGNAKGTTEPSITDEEALALWDMLTATVRLREASDATIFKKDRVSLATQVISGKICPESGWWETIENQVANNDRRKFLRAGDIMPPVTTSAALPFWKKILGESRLKISTTWTLVDYDDESVNTDPTRTAAGPSVQTDGIGDQHA